MSVICTARRWLIDGPGRNRRIKFGLGTAFALLILLPVPGLSYERDSHYYLRYGLSLATCFDWGEAHLIASGDWGMDENGSTHAEMNPVQTRNKIDWHAFGHSDRRFHELWLRSVNEPNLDLRLIKLGQFMHFLEDWEAHAGYGIRMGHARDTFAGRDPDSLGNSFPKNHRMVQSALDHLLATCEDLGRLELDRDQHLIEIMNAIYADELLEDLFEASEPDWKRRKLGSYRKEAPLIKAANKERIEAIVMNKFKQLQEKNIPANFAPGPETGIPPSLGIPFDREGNVLNTLSVRESVREWASFAERSPDISLSMLDARIYFRRSGNRQLAGWRVRLNASNVGELDSEPGHIEIVVIDSDDENILAQVSEPLPPLRPGESRDFRVNISAKRHPEPDVIIASFARVGDLTAMNDEDWLMLGDAEAEQPDRPIVVELDPLPAGPETVSFLEPPRLFVIEDSVCVVVKALVSAGDSPAKLDKVVGEFIIEVNESLMFQRAVPGRWSAMTTDRGLVAGKTFECFRLDQESADFVRTDSPQPMQLAITLEAEGSDPYTEAFPIDPKIVRAVLVVVREAP